MISRLLEFPLVYDLFQRCVGGVRCRQHYVEKHLCPIPGQRVLDIGCGTGDMLQFFPPVEYHGWDPSPAYIDRATKRQTPNSYFNCGVFSEQQLDRPSYFDLAHSAGVLHHLNDEEARQLIRTAHAALKPGGRFFSLDGCYYPQQSWLAKLCLSLDRGKFVRDEPSYRLLAGDIFEQIETQLYPKLIRPLPYPVLIMKMTKASCPD